jgi:hypothetical protein
MRLPFAGPLGELLVDEVECVGTAHDG